jgi:hypothetical protein
MAEPFRARYIIVVIVGIDVNGATFTISEYKIRNLCSLVEKLD